MTKYSLRMIPIFLGLIIMGCGGGSTASNGKMEAPELGISVYAPSGWSVDRHNPRMCFKGDNTGIILDEPLEGKSFDEYVQQLSEANSGKVISTATMSVSGFDAILTVIEYPNVGSKSIKVFIHKGDRLIEISFVTPAEDFPEYETSLRKSIQSITIE
ncbi:MAG: hypothetical protein ACP5FK_07640 [bacterium]